MSDFRYGSNKDYFTDNTDVVREAFDRDSLALVCEMLECDFGDAFDMVRVECPKQEAPSNFYYYKDNGSNILAVAHLDTVVEDWERSANFVTTEAGEVVFSGALDDRLGAYIILVLLPVLGIKFDVLLTVGEESGQSTAAFFAPEKEYQWMIEFDRGGTDVVLYQYHDLETSDLVEESGATVARGIFSDISYMEHLEIKGFNWGVGYRDYHGPRSHAYLEDTFEMVSYFLNFYEANRFVYLPHDREIHESYSKWGGGYRYRSGDEDWKDWRDEQEDDFAALWADSADADTKPLALTPKEQIEAGIREEDDVYLAGDTTLAAYLLADMQD